MKKKPTKTKKSQHLPIDAYDALDEKDKLWVDMAVNSYPYKIIAEKAKVTYQTVAHWFDASGRLTKAYQQRLAEHRSEFDAGFEKINQLIKDGAVLAILKEIEAVKSSGAFPSQIMAAKDILSRAGFDPVDKSEGSLTLKTDGALVEAALKDLDEADKETD